MEAPTTARRCPDVPHDAWYVAATAEEVGRTPLARRVLGRRVVLYRTSDGTAVALGDRCAHRPVPLSTGRLEGDDIVAAYTGFRYAPDGRCVGVPTQENVPFDASVAAYPVREDGSFVWIWPGDARRAGLRPPPATTWLREPPWASFGEAWETRAALRLLQDNFADITHVARVDPDIAPPALGGGAPPPLEVRVSETTVRFFRDYPPAPVTGWHAQVLGLPEDSEHRQREEGEFVSPGLWVDRWRVSVVGHGAADGEHDWLFTHALTPVDERTTRHVWRVSRSFTPGPAAEGTLAPIFRRYYGRVRASLEGMQTMLDEDGPAPGVSVAADAAGSQVRRIMDRLVADETAT